MKSRDIEFAHFNPENVALINFSLDPDEIHHIRSIYNALDLLGDVGGLFEGLRIISYIFIILAICIAANFLMDRIY